MPLEDFLKVLDSINSKPHPQIIVVITGGEPLLRKDLEECGFAIRKKGFRWGIVTNGLEYSKERHMSLLNAGMGAITLSFDGLKENHNWLRNNSLSWDNALNAMELIASEKRLNSDIVTCVHSKNVSELEEIYQIIKKSGMRAWRLFTIAPIGRALNYHELLPDGELLNSIYQFINDKRKLKEIDIKFSCEAYTGKWEEKVRDGFFFCRAGIHIGSVLIDGSIGACPNIDRSMVQGNIYQDDFSEIWENKFDTYRNRDGLKKGICNSCSHFKDCLGGAMHLRNPESGEILFCHYNSAK
jgi:radical SAM protein with 4Fe4S-binding SPASM domain